jgi:hypothetical protein
MAAGASRVGTMQGAAWSIFKISCGRAGVSGSASDQQVPRAMALRGAAPPYQRLGDVAFSKIEKVNSELFTLT